MDQMRPETQPGDDDHRMPGEGFVVQHNLNYVQVLDHLTMGLAILDENCRILFWNRWITEHSGLTMDDVYGRPIHEIFPTCIHTGFIKKVQRAIALGSPAFLTGTPDHHIFPFFSSRSLLCEDLQRMQQTVIIAPLKEASGTARQVLITVFDITDWVDNREQLLESRKRLQRLSQLDELTQLPNRRAALERLRTECSIHARKKRALSVVLIDVDNFKELNDTHGRQCGDRVLVGITGIITGALRGYDTICRYSGDEFLLILPETELHHAEAICERLRQTIADETFLYEDLLVKLTVSIGIACRTSEDAANEEEILRRVDACLYHAKNTGRNRVVSQAMI